MRIVSSLPKDLKLGEYFEPENHELNKVCFDLRESTKMQSSCSKSTSKNKEEKMSTSLNFFIENVPFNI